MMLMGLRSSCARLAILAGGMLACDTTTTPVAASLPLIEGAPISVSSAGRLVQWDPSITPLSLRPYRGGYAVIDRTEQQLVLLDSALTVQRRIGRRGSGPGELRGAVRIETWAHGLAVGESANGRFSLFDDEGRLLAVSQRRFLGTPFGIDATGMITTPVQTPPQLIDRGHFTRATPTRTGTRPHPATPIDARHTGRDLVLVTETGDILLLENRTGVLLQLDDDGRVTRRWTFPEPFIEGLRRLRRDRVALFESRTGSRVYAAPLIKDASLLGRSILIAFSATPACLAVVDLDASQFHVVQVDDASLGAALCRAESVALTSSALAVATDDSLIRLATPHLRRPN